jgi:hypothetical protein
MISEEAITTDMKLADEEMREVYCEMNLIIMRFIDIVRFTML